MHFRCEINDRFSDTKFTLCESMGVTLKLKSAYLANSIDLLGDVFRHSNYQLPVGNEKKRKEKIYLYLHLH